MATAEDRATTSGKPWIKPNAGCRRQKTRCRPCGAGDWRFRSEEHTSELQSLRHLVCRLLLEKKKRAFMRQDPDIIMVGEIRDLATAEIALTAAQTGHLVQSTMHTNDGTKTLTRIGATELDT